MGTLTASTVQFVRHRFERVGALTKTSFAIHLGKGHEMAGEESCLFASLEEGERERERSGPLLTLETSLNRGLKQPDCRSDCICRGIMKILLASSAPEEDSTRSFLSPHNCSP